MSRKSLRTERVEATRQALVDSARKLFAERGFAATPTEEIVRAARVTRGALYHHFRDKKDLFERVFEVLHEEMYEKVRQAAVSQEDAWDTMLEGVRAFLDACLEPDFQRVVLVDAPAVLGWQHWRDMDGRYGLGMVRNVLESAMDAGVIARQPVDPLAHMLLAALDEAAMYIARSPNHRRARKEVEGSLMRILNGLREPPG